MQVTTSFPFDTELRRIGLAQALRHLGAAEVQSRVARLFVYAAAGVCPVGDADDRDAVRRHEARLAATQVGHPVPARNT